MKFLVVAGFSDSLLGFRWPLICELLRAGISVHAAAPGLEEGSNTRDELVRRGVIAHDIPMHRTGMNPLADLRSLFALWRLMRRIRPEYVLGYTIKPVIYGSIAASLARVPHRFALITGLGHAFQSQGNRRGKLEMLVQGLYRLALTGVEKVFFQNPDDEALFRGRLILKPSAASCVVNGSGVDINDFGFSPTMDTPVHFLLIARLLAGKGVRLYAQAAERIRASYPEVVFSLVGWLDENPDAITAGELETWERENTINYLGRLTDVRPAIRDCSVYVLPSYYREGTPRTVLEAMAMGRAIITTDAPGCRETVIEGENGFLVPLKSLDALEQAMLKFVENPSLASRMGKRSRQIAEDKYDVHKVNEVMLREMGIQ